MTRFFVTPQEMNTDRLILTGENAAHAKVLRLTVGEKVVVCDGCGTELVCEVSDIESERIGLLVLSQQASETEPKVKVSVYMAFSKGDKFEHVIQKATELGAYEIVAFPASRCVSRPDEKSIKKKLERWQKIATSAAEQSGRGRVPAVLVMDSYHSMLQRARSVDKAILFYENEQAKTLQMVLRSEVHKSISVITGPEGGFDPSEITMAAESGMQICTLGRRILRCETAPLCALSAIMYDSGEF